MRKKRFTFVCNDKERARLLDLSKRLQRSQSDSIRLLIQYAINRLTNNDIDLSNSLLYFDPDHKQESSSDYLADDRNHDD